MRLTDIATTKSNLLRLKERLGFVKAGHALLEQKREVLLEELLVLQRDAAALRRRLDAALSALYGALRNALVADGRAALDAEALGSVHPATAPRVRRRERSVMGVVVPLLELVHDAPTGPTTAPGWLSPHPAHVRTRLRALLAELVHLAEVEVSCHRLALELQRTQRKVNALENIFIPQYDDTIRFIEASLEEKEREALFHLKRLKARRGATHHDAGEHR